jgi:hypothetical protein
MTTSIRPTPHFSGLDFNKIDIKNDASSYAVILLNGLTKADQVYFSNGADTSVRKADPIIEKAVAELKQGVLPDETGLRQLASDTLARYQDELPPKVRAEFEEAIQKGKFETVGPFDPAYPKSVRLLHTFPPETPEAPAKTAPSNLSLLSRIGELFKHLLSGH